MIKCAGNCTFYLFKKGGIILRFKGKIITPGVAYAKVYHVGIESYKLYRDSIKPETVEIEIRKFKDAVKVVLDELIRVHDITVNCYGLQNYRSIENQIKFLSSKQLIDSVAEKIAYDCIHADLALKYVAKDHKNEIFKKEFDGYLDVIQDIKYACASVYDQLHEVRKQELQYINEEVILVADEITPIQMALI